MKFFTEYVKEHTDWELVEIYVDEGVTGTSTKKREAFNRMINDAREGKFDLILVKDVSRFARNTCDALQYARELKKMNVAVHFVSDGLHTDDEESELPLTLMATFAQEESRKTSKRVSFGQLQKMKDGVVFGTSLLGYDVHEGVMTINPEGAEIVKLIFYKYVIEQLGTTEIAKFLTENGYRTSRGSTKWKGSTVVKILHNEKYVGDLVQRKTFTPDFLSHAKKQNHGEVPFITLENHHDPIISREMWNMAQTQLRANDKRNYDRTKSTNRNVFSGKIKCGECGASFVGHNRTLADHTKMRRWNCSTTEFEGSEACNVGKIVRHDDAVHMLQCAINNLPIDKESIIDNVTKLSLKALKASGVEAADNPEHLKNEIERIEYKKEHLLDSYLDNNISKAVMQDMMDKYQGKLDALRERLAKVERMEASGCACSSHQLKAEIEAELAALLNGEGDNEAFYRALLDQMTVYKDRHIELRLNNLPQVFQFAG